MPPSDLDELLAFAAAAATGAGASDRVERVTVGLSGATVERRGARFCKSAPPTWDRGLDAEHDRLRWLATTPLAGHVPAVLAFDPGPPVERLLTTALPGHDLTADAIAAALSPTERARRFGAALRALHDGLDPTSCPFDARIDGRLAAAAQRVAEGLVDPADFDDERQGRTPADVLDELVRTRPAERAGDLVVTHGDWCFPNVVMDPANAATWGVCDLAGLGVADRWNDLGIGLRSTGYNTGEDTAAAFLDGYGIDVDPERARWYVLLDELQ